MAFYNTAIKFIAPFYPSLLWHQPRTDKTLYLTFDDGPIPGITDFVLDELLRHQIKGTFFCVGENIERNNQQFTRILGEGHQVGNHTHQHLNGWNTTVQDYLKNVQWCDHAMQPYLHNKAIRNRLKPLFRPPYGRITRAQILALQHQYRIVMWDVLSGDFDKQLTPEKCLKVCLKFTKPGTVIIFHDSVKAAANLEFVLPRFIQHYLSQGYSFKCL